MYQFGNTPLMHVAKDGRLPMVEYLVEKGADIEAGGVVSGVISLMCNHPFVTYESMCECISGARLH